MDPWKQPQKRVTLPTHKRIIPADPQDMATLDQFLNESTVEIHYEPNDETDYAVWNADGSVTRVSECVTINGTQWWLVPGENRLPKSVYEFLMQCPEQRRRVSCPEPNKPMHLGKFEASAQALYEKVRSGFYHRAHMVAPQF